MGRIEISIPALHEAQERVRSEAKRFNAVMCGRRWGKTLMGTQLVLEAALKGQPAAWFAPTYKMLSDQWRELSSTLAPVIRDKSVQEKRLELLTGGVIEFWSLDHPDAGRGRKYALAITDEAGIVRELEQAWAGAILPTLTDLGGSAWFLGTPKGRRYFYQLFQRGQAMQLGWASWQMPTRTNPYIPPDMIEQARAIMPEAVFRQEYEAIPDDDAGNPFGLAHIAACCGAVQPGPVECWGVDLARTTDWTVLIGLNAAGAVCAFERWQGIPWTETIDRIARTIGDTKALVDCTGIGDPIVDALQRRCPRVQGYQFTRPSKQQLIEGLSVAIQGRMVIFPAGPVRAELEAFEFEYTPTGVRYSAPEGFHDDCVCALALAWMCRTRTVGSRVYHLDEEAKPPLDKQAAASELHRRLFEQLAADDD